MELKFVKMGINGEGISYLNNQPVFCPGVFPNETAEVEITGKKKGYYTARVKKMIWRTKERMPVDYPYYEDEGCPLFPMKYDAQLVYKRKLLCEALYKYANVKEHFVRDVKPSPLTEGYRNSCKLPVQETKGRLSTGMYAPGTNHFHPIDHSVIQDQNLEEVRMSILKVLNSHHFHAYDEKKKKGLRFLCLRILDDQVQCTLVTGKDILSDDLVQSLMKVNGLVSLFQSVNTETKGTAVFGSRLKKLAGKDSLTLSLHDLKMQISPGSFYQMNTAQAESLYDMAVSKVDKCQIFVEAYCGIGAMSLLACKKAKHVYGIESSDSSINDAKKNAEENHIDNTAFICGDAADELLKLNQSKNIDCLLADPPRAGMNRKMIEAILQVKPKKVIYISCNPATLGKNLNDLKHQYHIVTIIPFDMFPHTPHIESITVLERDNYAENLKN